MPPPPPLLQPTPRKNDTATYQHHRYRHRHSKRYRSSDMWNDALRVAKFHGGQSAHKRVAYAWALALGGDAGAKLLNKQVRFSFARRYEKHPPPPPPPTRKYRTMYDICACARAALSCCRRNTPTHDNERKLRAGAARFCCKYGRFAAGVLLLGCDPHQQTGAGVVSMRVCRPFWPSSLDYNQYGFGRFSIPLCPVG